MSEEAAEKVSNAVILAEVQHIASDVSEIKTEVKELGKLVTDHGQSLTRFDERWEQHKRDHQGLTVKQWGADIIGPIVAAVVALLIKQP